jgi:hypothetical protein
MYKAKILDVREENDQVKYFVEYSDGAKVEIKTYSYVMANEIDCATHGIDAKIADEIEKLNNPEVDDELI